MPRTFPDFTPDFSAITAALRGGGLVDDRVFDEVFPCSLRARSSVYWTPVEVAVRAAQLLAGARVHDREPVILDVGAGAGKFCLVAAAVTKADVRGLEHRPHLVEAAREAARKLGVRATFEVGTLSANAFANVDGFYFFNPFAENLSPNVDRLDDTVVLSHERFTHDLDVVHRLLANACLGARVVTFCGLGRDMPFSFDRVSLERCGGGPLELWVKAREG